MKILIIAGGEIGASIVASVLSLNLTLQVKLVVRKDELHLFSEHTEKIGWTVNKFGDVNDLPSFDSFDLGICAGWSSLILPKTLNSTRLGFCGFHPSLLPDYRGRSVIAWQIEDRIRESGTTLFWLSELADAGDIIGQFKYQIDKGDYASDVLRKCNYACVSLIEAYLPLIAAGVAPRRPQDWNYGSYKGLRSKRHQEIDLLASVKEIHAKIRAVSTPYPCALMHHSGKLVTIERAEIICRSEMDHHLAGKQKLGPLVGKAFETNGELFLVARDGLIKATRWRYN